MMRPVHGDESVVLATAFRTALQHRQVDPALLGGLDRDLVSGVCVPHDPGARVGGQHPLQPAVGAVGAVGYRDHARSGSNSRSRPRRRDAARPSWPRRRY